MATFCSPVQIHGGFANGVAIESLSNSSTEIIDATTSINQLVKHPATSTSVIIDHTFTWKSAGFFPAKSNYNRNNSILENATTVSIPILLYPIPRRGGKFQIVINDVTAVHEIMINDTKGNKVRSYPGFKGSRLVITGLNKGSYLVRIKNLSTKKIFTEKLIMKE